jgi:hypothetical protein
VVLNDRNPLIALISSEGLLSLVNDKGEVVASRQFDKLNSKDTKLALAQINESESPLIFIYGGSNYMTAVNDNLQILSGFPINGYTKPSFSDINNDGSVEVISAGYDKKFYIYTLRENQ